MKLNWGTGIAIFLSLFIAFILMLVVKAHQIKSDLYAEDYYDQEVNYQQSIDAKNRGKAYEKEITVLVNAKGEVEVIRPNWMLEMEEGLIKFYRPDDAKLDREFSFKTYKKRLMVLEREHFSIGHYKVAVFWELDGLPYKLEKTLVLK